MRGGGLVSMSAVIAMSENMSTSLSVCVLPICVGSVALLFFVSPGMSGILYSSTRAVSPKKKNMLRYMTD